MFVFDLFEKKKQDAAAGRFVGGTSQDARVKNALDNAYRAVPAAKSPEEAALGYIDIQNSLNQKQDQALAQQNKTNQQQTQQINDLVADMRRKEKDFRDLNAQIANMPNVTPQQAAKMAQDIEAAHDAGKDQAVDVPNVVAKQTTAQPAKAVAAPGPGASVSQLANYQQAKDQGAATAKTTAKAPVATPQATPAPATSKALGQMASQLATPGRVIKGKNQQAQQTTQPTQTTTTAQPAQQELPVNVTAMPSTPAAQQRLQQLSNLGLAANSETYQQVANMREATSPSDLQAIAQHNNQAFSQAWAHSQSTKLYFGDGQWEDLTFQEVEQIVSAIATDYTEQARPQVWQQLFTDHNYFNEFKAQHLSQMPLQFKEGDVVPMTDNETTNQAYADALIFLKRVYANPNDPMITTMRQDFAHKYQQRFQISQAPAPDRSYYLLDKQLSKKYKLPTPDFKGLEEDSWHNGQNSWSSEHDQWAKESTSPASPKDSIQRYLAIDAEDDVEAVKAAIHAISKDPELKPTAKARLLGQVGMIIKTHRLPIGRAYYQFMQQFMESQGKEPLSVGDPVIVTAPNEYEGKTGEIAEFSPSGNFVIVDLYNYGEHSMHLSDVEYNKYADEELDETIRKLGSQYRLYSGKGKNLGTFPTRAGAEKHEREVQYFKHAGEGVEEGWSEGVAEAGDRVDPILIRALERMPDGLATHDQVLNAAYDAYAMELGKMKMKSDYGVTRAYIPQLMDLYKNKYGLDIKEAQTDFFKRRERERKVDAGQPVAKQRQPKMTDYQKKRAQDKKEMELGETTNYWTRLQNERNTKIASLVSELTESVKDIK